MVNTDRLRGIIAERHMSQSQVARHLGLSVPGFYDKMNKGAFWVSEAEKMIILLDIKDPVSIFFTDVVTQ